MAEPTMPAACVRSTQNEKLTSNRPIGGQQVVHLVVHADALRAQDHVHCSPRRGQQAALIKAAAALPVLDGRAQAEHAQVFQASGAAADCLDHGHHGGVVRPDSTVDQPGARQRGAWHMVGAAEVAIATSTAFPPVPAQARMVRCAEQVDVAGAQVVGRDHQALGAVAKARSPKDARQRGAQRIWLILRP